MIVVLVGSLNDWQKERQFRALNEKKDDRTVKVIRDGREQQDQYQGQLKSSP
jgi:Ca2+-transporting ATPase